MTSQQYTDSPLTFQLNIDKEFQELIPPLSSEERELLEASIKTEGCRDAIVVWKGHNVIIDGHNRYSICSASNLSFKTVEREFETRADVKVWMLRNQLGRRNLPEPTRVRLALLLKPALKVQAEERMMAGKKSDPVPNSAQGKTRDNMAEVAGVGKTKFSQAEYVFKNGADYIQALYNGEQISVNRAYDLTKALEHASEVVRNDCTRLEITDPQLISLLEEKKSTETYTEFVASGYIQLTGEDDAIAAKDATAWDFQGWLREKSREYNKAAIERRQDAKIAAIKNEPQGVYSVIYADPPWEYQNSGLYGAAERHYPTMATKDIDKLLESIHLQVADNAILFLWATNPLLIDAFEVLASWGFQYKTNIVWDKEKATTGLGFYVRGQHELLLIAVKGDGAWTPKERPASVIREAKEGHSSKPHSLYGLIERMYPGQRYIELFARDSATREGWTFWGSETDERLNAA